MKHERAKKSGRLAADFKMIKPLLKKQFGESLYPYQKGNFSIGGFILHILLIAAIAVIFVVFFSKFVGIYLAVKTNHETNVPLRSLELLTIVYTCILVFLVIGGVAQISRELFGGDDIKLFPAMPVSANSIFIAKIITIYLSQLVISTVIVFSTNAMFASAAPQPWHFWLVTVVMCFVLPLITIAIASILVAPYELLRRFLNERFVLSFIVVTVLMAALFYLYAVVLSAVKEMLTGSDLRYFFNSRVMKTIASVVAWLYPARLLANIMVGRDILMSVLVLVAVIAVCMALATLIIKKMLIRTLQSRNAGDVNYGKKVKKISAKHSTVFALVKKEFLLIFRTPSYRFSYLSVAVIMPMMVYFCMTAGTSLVERLIGINCNFELAIFLTIMLGALTNVFCATNISRDGNMFYSIKAYPLGHKTVFLSKVLLCLFVSILTQFASALVLAIAGLVKWYMALVLFVMGVLFSLVNILVATRNDFAHPKFSTEDDGEIKESGNVVSIIVLLGFVMSVLVGGSVIIIRIVGILKGTDSAVWSYLIPLLGGLVATAAAYLYFVSGLGKKYYEFEGGN